MGESDFKWSLVMIKFVLISLHFALTIQGLQIQNGDPDWFVEDDSARAGACVINCVSDTRDTCEGFVEFINEGESIYKLRQERNQPTRAFSRIPLRDSRVTRTSQKVLVVEGNCCWQIYRRSQYRGDMKILRGNDILELAYVPRSMKIIPC